MQSRNGFIKMQPNEVANWLSSMYVARQVKYIQLHHTWQPDYTTFRKLPDEFALQSNMKSYHVNSCGMIDIAQHFTVFPNGVIMTGRSLNNNPAGIVGGNSNAICIENLGNFDRGHDEMTSAQKEAIIILVQSLMHKFNLSTSSIRYHAWYSEEGMYLGDYNSAKSAKTCPGTAFFGGNTKAAFKSNLKPLLEGSYVKEEDKPMTADERKAFDNLSKQVNDLTEAFNQHMRKDHMVYDYVDNNMPDWCKPIVSKAIEVGMLKGAETDANGNITKLGLTLQDIKALAYDLREKGYDV